MLKCVGCEKWFSSWEILESQCIHCEEPWKEHDASKGVDLPDGPPSYWDLLAKLQCRPVKHEVMLPFAHDPKNFYVEATVYEGEGRYWYIEGRSSKFKDSTAAVLEVVKTADMRRMKMLNEEFEKEFGNDHAFRIIKPVEEFTKPSGEAQPWESYSGEPDPDFERYKQENPGG